MNRKLNVISFDTPKKSKFDILHEESLAGKIKNIQEMEKLFDSISDENPDDEKKYVNIAKMNQIATKLEKLICQEFNFADVAIEWTMLNTGPCTIPVYPSYFDLLMGNYDYKVVKSSEGGYRWQSSKGKYAWINLGMIGWTNVTSKEIMALLLHEIGHSFNYYSTTWQKLFQTLITPVMFCVKFFNYFKSKVTKKISELPGVKLISYAKNMVFDRVLAFNGDVNKINTALAVLLYPAQIMLNMMAYIVKTYTNPTNLFTFGMQYEHELQSDKFAMIYGYAYPLASVMKKFHNASTGKSIINLNHGEFGHGINKIANATALLICLVDVHPNCYKRILNAQNYIEKELKTAKNPKGKKFLKMQKDGIEKTVKAYHSQNMFKPFAKGCNEIDRLKESIFFVNKTKENINISVGSTTKNRSDIGEDDDSGIKDEEAILETSLNFSDTLEMDD